MCKESAKIGDWLKHGRAQAGTVVVAVDTVVGLVVRGVGIGLVADQRGNVHHGVRGGIVGIQLEMKFFMILSQVKHVYV